MDNSRSRIDFFIPLFVVIVIVAITLVGGFDIIEHRVYNLFLRIKPPVEEHPSILFLDVDDLAISKVGMWPWSRELMADGLITMKEFGAEYAVFDIEYTEESRQGVDSEYLERELPHLFSEKFSKLKQNTRALFQALASGSIPLSEAEDYINDLEGITERVRKTLLSNVRNITRDNDAYLGKAAHLFENAYFTVSMLPDKDPDVPQELKTWTLDNIALQNITVEEDIIPDATDIRPAIKPVLRGAAGAGFPNIVIDPDGVRRRVDLLRDHKGEYFAQLAFEPLLDLLGDPAITVNPNTLVLQQATFPDGSSRDVNIPLAEDNRLLINWPKKSFEQSFRHLSYYYLVLADRQEEQLLHNIRLMDRAGYLNYYQGETHLLAPYRQAETIKNRVLEGGDPTEMKRYREFREHFVEKVDGFLNGNAEEAITAEIENLIQADDTPEARKQEYRSLQQEVASLFEASRTILSHYKQTRSILEEELQGSFVLIGWTGTSTTDRGVNPFDEDYDNVGTHAAVANTILQQQFLDTHPWWYSILIGAAFAFGLFFAIRHLDPRPSLLLGSLFMVVLIGGSIGYFILTNTYLPMFTPVFVTALTFVSLMIVKVVLTTREKSFIRNAFGHYLSDAVIDELINDPQKLTLGGNKQYMTALFTDIKGFSSISEDMDPADLVTLLNRYLSTMSDIVLNLDGTIDKYEGDAIIGFFGAPVPHTDHARRACVAAVEMKQREKELNDQLMKEGTLTKPLLTRIGINTGEMVVGNMGTERKMNYTMMGNAVNLAARLEGVNKQYGSWILVSETTYMEAAADVTVRRLDRVRVVGIERPLRLYEVLAKRSETTSETLEMIKNFHIALALFEDRRWDNAKAQFQKVLEMQPDDKPSQFYIKRCEDFKQKPPPQSWDGVFNLTLK